ncbi:hypothetical protein KP005_19365 [Geomonas nitrogeniifigens]|uniref:Uncharacterized protein n=1 Tax=Geomonas diazotrophica TaxID=2843197 RepID=A0ABX8JLE2_9BACT|nr:hypothetical protein [Geomonas nitrogeniifigens]QWV97467.1 hypothetical protein KP005_19365 [Geomonas nitrogeniifigens]
MDDLILRISRVSGYRDTAPVAITTTWGAFRDRCQAPQERGVLPLAEYLAADKATRDRQKDGTAIIAGTFSHPRTRLAEDLVELSMVVLDLDDGYYTFDQLCEKLECFECVVFTSYSHSEQTPKFRVYLPLANPLTGQIKPALERIIDYFDDQVGHLDPACRKPGQLFYAPAYPPGGADIFQCRHIEGLVLDPADFPETEAAPRPRFQRPALVPMTGSKPGDIFNATANWADILEPLGWRHCFRNHWTRPGKQFGVSASVLSAGFYIHSSAPETAPFVCGKTYTLFGAYALAHHGGDFSAAARELRHNFVAVAA